MRAAIERLRRAEAGVVPLICGADGDAVVVGIATEGVDVVVLVLATVLVDSVDEG